MRKLLSRVSILALTGVNLVYLPREWTFSIGVTEAQSAFSGLGTQWRPSEIARLGFPILRREEKQLSGNVFFATGTEDFASIDQIGSFASQTFGAGLRAPSRYWPMASSSVFERRPARGLPVLVAINSNDGTRAQYSPSESQRR